MPEAVEPGSVRHWGNALYINLALGEAFNYKGRMVTLLAMEGDACQIDIDGQSAWLRIARAQLPTILNGVRVFLAQNRVVADLTANAPGGDAERGLTGDAMLCLSSPKRPLLDRRTFGFPIDRNQGFEWSMEESNAQCAMLAPGLAPLGIDIDLHEARGSDLHGLLAIEDSYVAWVDGVDGDPSRACVLLESASERGLYYVYQHLWRSSVQVEAGQFVRRGQPLGTIWGDAAWGHLHFGVIGYGPTPAPGGDFQGHEINAFPMLYELYHGDLTPRPRVWRSGRFSFGRHRALDGCKKRLAAYSDLLGYGWTLGRWNAAGAVESSGSASADWGGNARLRNPLFPGTRAECVSPEPCFEFAVAVPDGPYEVQAMVGDGELATWQRLTCNGAEMGDYTLEGNRYAMTPAVRVDVEEGLLCLRLELTKGLAAGLAELSFTYVGREPVAGATT